MSSNNKTSSADQKALRILGIVTETPKPKKRVPAPRDADVSKWSTANVVDWVHSIPSLKKPADCGDAFRKHDIDGETLFDLTMEVLRDDLAVPVFGDRNRIMKALRTLMVHGGETTEAGAGSTLSPTLNEIEGESGDSPKSSTHYLQEPSNARRPLTPVSASEAGALTKSTSFSGALSRVTSTTSVASLTDSGGMFSHPWSWSVHEVHNWLCGLGLRKYSDKFMEHHVAGISMMNLSDELLLNLGVKKEKDRKTILDEIKVFIELRDIYGSSDDLPSVETTTVASSSSSKRSKTVARDTSNGLFLREGDRRPLKKRPQLKDFLTKALMHRLDARKPKSKTDYSTKVLVNFQLLGARFGFLEYAPGMFEDIRKLYGITRESFRQSMVVSGFGGGEKGEGKSGQIFWHTMDGKYLIKTITRTELRFFRSKFMQKYHRHLARNKHSLLSKFLGMYKVLMPNGRHIRLIVMNNVFETDLDITEKFDLKGSTRDRYVPPQDVANGMVAKDLNFSGYVALAEQQKLALNEQIRRDVDLLQSCNVMDYSFLLGIHSSNGEDPQQSGRDVFHNTRKVRSRPTDGNQSDPDVGNGMASIRRQFNSSSRAAPPRTRSRSIGSIKLSLFEVPVDRNSLTRAHTHTRHVRSVSRDISRSPPRLLDTMSRDQKDQDLCGLAEDSIVLPQAPNRSESPDQTTLPTASPDHVSIELVSPDQASSESVSPDQASSESVSPDQASSESVSPDQTSTQSGGSPTRARGHQRRLSVYQIVESFDSRGAAELVHTTTVSGSDNAGSPPKFAPPPPRRRRHFKLPPKVVSDVPTLSPESSELSVSGSSDDGSQDEFDIVEPPNSVLRQKSSSIKRRLKFPNPIKSLKSSSRSSSKKARHQRISSVAAFFDDDEKVDLENLQVSCQMLDSSLFPDQDHDRNVTAFQHYHNGFPSQTFEAANGVVYFVGIIDILQEFTNKKRVESTVKRFKERFLPDPQQVSAVESHFYGTRFKAFLENKML